MPHNFVCERTEHYARCIAEAFDFGGPILDLQPYGGGIINDTFLVTPAAGPSRRVILQRINPQVFPNPAWIMANLRVALDHIRQRLATATGPAREFRLPAIHPGRDGRDYAIDAAGGFWRALGFIDNTCSYATLSGSAQAEEVGFALGRFHALIHDLEPERLHDTLPGFHITPQYLDQYVRVAGDGADGPEWRWCRDFIAARRGLAPVLETARQEGRLRLRPIHGDPKLNNVLFDRGSGRAVSLIDLDTLKPGLIHYDVGDCLRSCCNTAGETPADPAAVDFDLDICRAVLGNYIDQTCDFLTAADYGCFYDAIRLIPFELGLRFLTDHLQSDRYFKVERPGHNLERALTQFHLTARIEQQEMQIRRLLRDLQNR